MAPINRDVNGVNQVLFFGGSVRRRDTGNDQPYLSYNARGADFHMTNNTLNTGAIGDNDTFWGLKVPACGHSPMNMVTLTLIREALTL